ncbi:MAG TPA: response regulator transcription factor [Candidatus Limnocylindrales bacterium]|nr:response regulator transcription factor [Candidatus Limnocylindrales bacterium]
MAAALTTPDAGRGALAGRDPIRVAVVDDHPVVRDGTAALLAAQPDLSVVGTAGSLTETADLLATTDIDVVLLDIRLGTDSGLTMLSSAAADHPLPAVVVVTAYDYPQYADAALRLGAAGFVLKTAPIAELVDAIRRAAAGGLAFARRPRTGPGSPVRLSARELEVVRLVVDGRSNDEIGAALGIGSKTVETHLRRLFERLGVASRTELATRALREGWLDVPPG